MNRFKFRLSLVELLRAIAAEDTPTSRARLASLWAKEFYPGFGPQRGTPEARSAEVDDLKRCFSRLEFLALEQFNRVVAACADGTQDLQTLAEAAAKALLAFQITSQPAADRPRDAAPRSSWTELRVC